MPTFELSGRDGALFANEEFRFSIKGVNWFGSEAYNGPPGGLDEHSIGWFMDFLQRHDFNAIRLLFNHEHVLKNDLVELKSDGEHGDGEQGLHGLRYLEVFALLAREAASRGILVVIACHRVLHDAWPGSGLWFDDTLGYPEARVKRSWSAVAAALCGESQWNVIGADLQNEPHSASWGKGLKVDWNLGAARIGDHVLSRCPRWLIVVEGVGYDPGAPGGDDPGAGFWWGENLVGVRTAGVQLARPDKLVYSPHVYGPSVYQQHYFDDHNFPRNMPFVWQSHFGFVQEATGRPILLGEIGGKYVDQDKQWQDWALDYCREKGFGLFYFALNPDSADTGGLTMTNWTEPTEGSVEAAKLAALSQMPATRVFDVCPECRSLANSSTPHTGTARRSRFAEGFNRLRLAGWAALPPNVQRQVEAVGGSLPLSGRSYQVPAYAFVGCLALCALYMVQQCRSHLAPRSLQFRRLRKREAAEHQPKRAASRAATRPKGKPAKGCKAPPTSAAHASEASGARPATRKATSPPPNGGHVRQPAAETAAQATSSQHRDAGRAALPAGWSEARDPGSGKTCAIGVYRAGSESIDMTFGREQTAISLRTAGTFRTGISSTRRRARPSGSGQPHHPRRQLAAASRPPCPSGRPSRPSRSPSCRSRQTRPRRMLLLVASARSGSRRVRPRSHPAIRRRGIRRQTDLGFLI